MFHAKHVILCPMQTARITGRGGKCAKYVGSCRHESRFSRKRRFKNGFARARFFSPFVRAFPPGMTR